MHIWAAGIFCLQLVSAAAVPQNTRVVAKPVEIKQGEQCNFSFSNPAESASTWEKYGVSEWLKKLLKTKGFEGWSDHFFEEYVGDESIGGATYSCVDIDSGSCAPATPVCAFYKTPEAFLVHQSINTYWTQLNKLASELDGEAIQYLLSEVKRIVKLFGPEVSNIKNLLTMLVGAFVIGAALAGPLWQLAAPMTATLGILNVVSGSLDIVTPEQVNDDLEATMGQFYGALNATMADTVGAFFGGSDKIQGLDSDPIDFVLDSFDKGKMLDKSQARKDTTALWDGTRKAIKLALIAQAMRSTGHYVSQRTGLSKEDCDKKYPKASWVRGHCTRIATPKKREGIRFDSAEPIVDIKDITDDRYNEIKDIFDYDAILENAIDCTIAGDGSPGDPQVSLKPPPFGEPFTLPPCFFNLRVRVESSTGKINGNAANKDGWCIAHINQKKPTTDDYAYEFEITLKDFSEEVLASVSMQKSDPYVVVEGKESNNDILPYNFYVAGGLEPGDLDDVFSPVHFWYGGTYWKSNGRACRFATKYESNNIRSGDCWFTCNKRTENPPPSATVKHPLPTGIGYVKGWCTLHIKQQRSGNGYWYISADVYDNDHHWVGWKKREKNLYGKSINISGALPNNLEVIPDRKTVKFNYATVEWSAADSSGSRHDGGHECRYGPWDGIQSVEMDCGFYC